MIKTNKNNKLIMLLWVFVMFLSFQPLNASPGAGGGADKEDGISSIREQMGRAVIDDDAATLRALLAAGGNVDTRYLYEDTLLHMAVRQGNEEIVEMLIGHSPNLFATINAVNRSGVTPINIAASEGHVKLFDKLMSLGADLSCVSNRGCSLLHNAVVGGSVHILKTLIEEGLTFSRDQKGKTLFHRAVIAHLYNDKVLKIVRILLRAVPDPDVFMYTDNYGLTALDIIGRENRSSLKTMLQEAYEEEKNRRDKNKKKLPLSLSPRVDGVEVSCLDRSFGTYLHFAASLGYLGELIALVEAKVVNINEQTIINGDTALHIATRLGQIGTALYLLRNGANFEIPNHWKARPIHEAATHRDPRILKELIRLGARVNDVDSLRDRTPLGWAVAFRYKKNIEILLKAGADVNEPNKKGQTALYEAIFNNRLDIVELLVSHGAGSFVDQEGNTPLHIAARYCGISIIRLLLRAQPNLELRNNEGKTAFDIMIESKKYEILNELLREGISLDESIVIKIKLFDALKRDDVTTIKSLLNRGCLAYLSNENKHTLWDYAVQSGNVGMVEFLLTDETVRQQLNSEDAYGRSALHYAVMSGNVETVRALLNAGICVGIRDEEGNTALRLSAKRGLVRIQRTLIERIMQQREELEAQRAEKSAQPVVCEGTPSNQSPSTQSR